MKSLVKSVKGVKRLKRVETVVVRKRRERELQQHRIAGWKLQV